MQGRVRVVRRPGGVRLLQDGAVISDVRASPGPTHGVFDVLAASVAALAPGPRALLLGFAAGGVVAPLRALGHETPLECVDVDVSRCDLFRELCGDWAGHVDVHEADAVAWLRRRRRRFDVVIDDLSVPGTEGVTKPAASYEALPELIGARLGRAGVAIVNLLPVPVLTWDELTERVVGAYAEVLVVHVSGYDNRILLAGAIPGARAAGRRLRHGLRAIGSRVVADISVRSR